MNKDLLDLIKKLSDNDDKSLIGKSLKTSEEVGELAKAVLPFENASGTLHRFSDKNSILEECADIYLCIMSMVYELGLDYEDFEKMVKAKSLRWSELQGRESIITEDLPFEIHVTVKVPDDIQLYKEDCMAIGVKPIVIDMEVMKDVMTSSIHMGSNRSCYEEMVRISENLRLRGYDVVREKIETVPWHPAAPSNKSWLPKPSYIKDSYFESHLAIKLHENKLSALRDRIGKTKGHLSKNAFKKYDNGYIKMMVTFREPATGTGVGTYEMFDSYVKDMSAMLSIGGFNVEKEIIEFAIYDTNVSHDTKWIEQ